MKALDNRFYVKFMQLEIGLLFHFRNSTKFQLISDFSKVNGKSDEILDWEITTYLDQRRARRKTCPSPKIVGCQILSHGLLNNLRLVDFKGVFQSSVI